MRPLQQALRQDLDFEPTDDSMLITFVVDIRFSRVRSIQPFRER